MASKTIVTAEAVPLDDEADGNVDFDKEEEYEHERPKKSLFTDDVGNLKIVNVIVGYPCVFFFFVIALCMGITIWLFSLVAADGNPFVEGYEYDLKDVRSIDFDSLKLARDDVSDAYDLFERSNPSRRLEEKRLQEDFSDLTYWIFDSKTDAGVFTEEAIPKMREAEMTILGNDNYSQYCHLNYTAKDAAEAENKTEAEVAAVEVGCMKPLSAMNIYYASAWNSTLANDLMSQLSDSNYVDLYNMFSLCLAYDEGCDSVPSSMKQQLTTTQETHKQIASMVYSWDGEGDLNSNVTEVTLFLAHINQLLVQKQHVAFFLDKNFNVSNPVSQYSRSMFYWGKLLNGTKDSEESRDKTKEFILQNLLDKWNIISAEDHNSYVETLFFMGVLIFDIIIKILVTDATLAIASFVAVFFYLRLMLGSWFLTAIGMFEIFMSLPLSWFVFSYIFQIKYFGILNVLCLFIVMAIGADDIFVFMDAYKQSASKGPEVLSSLETRMSWVFRRSGSAMLLTSVTTCAAFLSTLSNPIAGIRSFGIFAFFVILFDYFLVMTLFCTSVVIYHNRFESKRFCCNCSFWSKSNPTPTESALDKGEEIQDDRISSFFKQKVAPFILSGRNRIILGVIFLAWIITTFIFTAQLKPTTLAEEFLKDDHMLQRGGTILTEEFPKTQDDQTSRIYFIWGLQDVDRSGVNLLLDPDFVGKPAFVDNFEFNELCQAEIMNACTKLREDSDLEDFILQKGGRRSVECFVEELGFFNVKAADDTCTSLNQGDWNTQSWTVSPDNLQSTMQSFVKTKSCINEVNIPTLYEASMGWDGESLRYAGIQLDSSVLTPQGVLAETETRTHYDAFVAFAKELDETMGDACQSKVIMTDLDQKFIFMNNQRIYRTSAFSGSMLGVAIAFVVIFISTRKLHISLFSTITILCILVGVVGSMTFLGWELGSIEAILISILAGFSVDYVIHLAHAYVHASGSPDERIIQAYGDMGISVFSGMLTSVVASIPLFFCTLVFFSKFGTFLCLTIVLSWIFANFFFMSLLAQFKISMDKKWL